MVVAGCQNETAPSAPSPAAAAASPAEEDEGGQSTADGVQIFAPDGSVAFNLVPWEGDWALVSPSGQMTGRVRAFGEATQVTDAAGKDVAASIRPFAHGVEIVDAAGILLATVRAERGGHRVLAKDGSSLLVFDKDRTPMRDGAVYKSPLRVHGDAFPLAATVLSLSSISFAGRVALLFFLSTPV